MKVSRLRVVGVVLFLVSLSLFTIPVFADEECSVDSALLYAVMVTSDNVAFSNEIQSFEFKIRQLANKLSTARKFLTKKSPKLALEALILAREFDNELTNALQEFDSNTLNFATDLTTLYEALICLNDELPKEPRIPQWKTKVESALGYLATIGDAHLRLINDQRAEFNTYLTDATIPALEEAINFEYDAVYIRYMMNPYLQEANRLLGVLQTQLKALRRSFIELTKAITAVNFGLSRLANNAGDLAFIPATNRTLGQLNSTTVNGIQLKIVNGKIYKIAIVR